VLKTTLYSWKVFETLNMCCRFVMLSILSHTHAPCNCHYERLASQAHTTVLQEPKSTTRTPATNTINGQKFATSQHLDMSRCWALALRCGKFVVELLWACPLVVFVAGVRVVKFGSNPMPLHNGSVIVWQQYWACATTCTRQVMPP